ncbi:hypothetical protein BGZ95_006557, partial [Linnemannia exigua]
GGTYSWDWSLCLRHYWIVQYQARRLARTTCEGQASRILFICFSTVQLNRIEWDQCSNAATSSTSGARPSSSSATPLDGTVMTNRADILKHQISTNTRKRRQKDIFNQNSNEDAVALTEEYQHFMEEMDAMVAMLDRRHLWKLNCTDRYVKDILTKATRACQVQ